MRPLTPVEPRTRVALGISFFVLFVAVWAAFTLSGRPYSVMKPSASVWSYTLSLMKVAKSSRYRE